MSATGLIGLYICLCLYPVGFEPTHPKITELESVALDHSATSAYYIYYVKPAARFELAIPVYETDALTAMLCWRI